MPFYLDPDTTPCESFAVVLTDGMDTCASNPSDGSGHCDVESQR